MEYFGVWCPDEGGSAGDARQVRACDPEHAAREFAERSYNKDPFSSEMVLHVSRNNGPDTTWAIMPEPDITFYSREISDGEQ